MIEILEKISNYICGRYYRVIYQRDMFQLTAEGVLINYNSGDIVLLSQDGIYHIKYKDILFMQPTKVLKLENYTKEFQDLLQLILK